MFFHNKVKQQKLHTKYESLHARLNKQHEQAVNIKNKKNEEQYKNNNNTEQLKNSIYLKNAQTNKNKNLYVSKKSRQQQPPQSDSTNNEENQNEETQNIYESVQEASVSVNNENADDQSMISRKTSRHLLNLTTNTIQSAYNNTVSASNLLTSKQNGPNLINKNSIELCNKYKRDQIEFDRIYLEGTFSRIYLGRLILTETNDLDQEDNKKEKLYDNFDTSHMQKRNSKRLSRCLSFDREKGYVRVLIKTVNDHASLEQTDMMLKESCLFQGLKHKNLNSLIGLCIEPDFHTLALFPFNEMGNLKLHLNSIRQSKPNSTVSNCSKNSENVSY
jgi:hypothetical protein